MPVYASPRSKGRKEMWDELINEANKIKKVWLIRRDFNDILNVSDKKRGNHRSSRRCKVLREMVNLCKLIVAT